jgi:hypothetical protein
MEQSDSRRSRTWLITPAVAVVLTFAGAVVLFKVQADRTIWLAACASRTFIACGLASIFFCAAAVLVAGGIGAGVGHRRSRTPGRAAMLGLVVAACSLAALLAVTVASGAVMS